MARGPWLAIAAVTIAAELAGSDVPAAVTHGIPVADNPVRMSADARYLVYGREQFFPSRPFGVAILWLDRWTGVETVVEPTVVSGFEGLALSAGGGVVAFATHSQLIAPDANGPTWDIYVKDMSADVLSRVSVSSDGVQADGHSAFPALSADGRYVAFSSVASNLVPGDTNGMLDVFVHDRLVGSTERVNVDSAGNQSTGDFSTIAATGLVFCHCPAISADGRHVAFWSLASDLVTGDTNSNFDAFVHDRLTGETTRVSVKSDGSQSVPVVGPVHLGLSGDGRYVAFESRTSDLDPAKTPPPSVQGVFLHDRATGSTELVSVNSSGESANALASGDPHLSFDGRYVTFVSTADNLSPGDTNGREDVFLRDRLLGTTVRANVTSEGNEGGGRVGPEGGPYQTSDDGRFVAFTDSASLDPDAATTVVYVRDLTCANGAVEGTEECDDGDLSDTNACDTTCRVTGCTPSVCGDGQRSGCEDCDDGNLVGGDCCSPTCTFEALANPCLEDANECTFDWCDGAGSCVHPPRDAIPCDDGRACNGADTCGGGACSMHADDPCAGGPECARACDDATGACADPAGTPCTADASMCTLDQCDGAGACAHPPVADGTACEDGDPCTTGEVCTGGSCGGGTAVACAPCERCDPMAGCTTGPRTECKMPIVPKRSRLRLQDRSPDDLDRLQWSWKKGAATTFADLGDPRLADDYALCVYDGTQSLLFRLGAPAGGTCGTVSCWKQVGRGVPTGYRYRDDDGLPDGVESLALRAGDAGRARIKLKGKGEHLPMPVLTELPLPLTVQLHAGGGGCWEATFTATGIRQETPTKFVASSD
jgi:cysteine-rich repeat protein